jgi:glutathione S-transferase
MGNDMKLYDFGFSSAAYRVRIALNLKGIAYDRVNIDLVKNGGEQHSASFKAVNPQELIPALETDGTVLAQSLAIIEYLLYRTAFAADLSGGAGQGSPVCVCDRL